ncbi:hypothetical protein [Blastococcus sp. SYSU DS0617]
MNRLVFTHLTFLGSDVPTATVSFGPGVTVVRGPSDTGKSFIVDAIDFMLGASKLKEIPERAGYSTALLGLLLPSGQPVTLTRSVNGGGIGLYPSDVRTSPLNPPPQTLAATHNASSEGSLSRYLLALVGLDNKRVRKNARNETKSLSFRNVSHLCVVDETQMQSEVPPALSGRPTDRTAEISTLKLFLQGEDDSDLIAVQSRAERSRVVNAKSEVIDELLAGLKERVSSAGEPAELRAQVARLNETVRQQSAAISELTDTRSRVAGQLAQLDRQSVDVRQRSGDIDTLMSRFRLLSAKYTSDFDRLEMIGEAGTLLGFFTPGTCVFCGAEPEYQHFNDHVVQDATHFGASVAAEQRKTAALNADLLEALADLERERSALSATMRDLSLSAGALDSQLRRLDEAITPQQVDLSELLNKRSALERHLADFEQIDRLNAMRAAIAAEGQAESAAAVVGLQLGTLSDFSQAVAQRLHAWGVPDADQVRYDRSEQDLVAGDQLRAAHGKGVRAILHAAFTIGLAQFCFERDLPHPGFVVLDSPLVTYRPPDHGEPSDAADILDVRVAARFYADIQASFGGQILIMENMDPPDGLDAASVDIAFTKTTAFGRYGFFPPRDNPIDSGT